MSGDSANHAAAPGGPEPVRPEFSHSVKIGDLGSRPHELSLQASDSERAGLAKRFDCLKLDRLEAQISATADAGRVALTGRMQAAGTQPCVATGDPVPFTLDEPIDLIFLPIPKGGNPDEEIELEDDELDTLFHDGRTADFGEAVAQSLALSLDPYPRGAKAAEVLAKAGVIGEDEVEPTGALSGLKAMLEGKT